MPTWVTPTPPASGSSLSSTFLSTVTGDLTYLSQPPAARMYQTVGQAIPIFTPTQLVGMAVDFASGVTTSTANEFIIQTAGKYLCNAYVTYGGAVDATYPFSVNIVRNNVNARIGRNGASSPNNGEVGISDIINCNAGDVLQLWTSQGTDNNSYTTDVSGQYTFLSILWVSF